MQPIDLRTARELIDFSGGDIRLKQLGELQLRGAVALSNMIADPDIGVGYLADEVGMGKTYVALGVVALMRYFNPALRVLYILPSGNVQEKWARREHPNFIKTNVKSNEFRIRTPDGRSGTPSISCSNIESLINAATTGYYGDIFVRMSSFSLGMGNEEEQLKHTLHRLKRHVPASLLADISAEELMGDPGKERVKEAYARAVNYLLPTFDLVIIDEAHNFKHNFSSSARNLTLSRILGLNREKGDYRQRMKNALLLSATPYDLDPTQLYNQLRLVGKERLMPDSSLWGDRDQIKQGLRRFMVRRLNELKIKGVAHTRNMYRREWRKGKRAEIGFETDEHKLITALVQKHVGDLLNRDRGNPSFQMGMLASFESYAQTAGIDKTEFDGDSEVQDRTEARDQNLIGRVRRSYIENDLGQSLPHPKMDETARSLGDLAFKQARKQLVFVRRVRSVNELKEKLDDQYDTWLVAHTHRTLTDNKPALAFMDAVVSSYHAHRKRRDGNTAGMDTDFVDTEGESVPPKNDTLFSWFFRGEQPAQLTEALSIPDREWPTPAQVRRSLTAKDNPNTLLFEFNWVDWFARHIIDKSIEMLLGSIDDAEIEKALATEPGVATPNRAAEYLVSQTIVLSVICSRYIEHEGWLTKLIDYLRDAVERGDRPGAANVAAVRNMVEQQTFFTQLAVRGYESAFFATAPDLACRLKEAQTPGPERFIHRLEVHRQLLAQTLRSGHGVIDLYLTRIGLGPGDLNDARRALWLESFIDRLVTQPLDTSAGADDSSATPFSTAVELNRLSDNLDLVLKNNLPHAYDIKPKELRRQLNYGLPPGAPVAGANGETTSNRSSQARKFRMPGYPLVLVSTDVFQEGEDLHTFCDSVVHYGLSASPVSIEQKTGRVDRVGAFAHRRLLAATNQVSLADEDYIQVSFPFVKQSIEAIQVRQLCRNLNDFIRSLHKVGENDASIEDQIDVERQLMDRGEIPDQILAPLSSPYDPWIPEKGCEELLKQIQTQTGRTQSALTHVNHLLQKISAEQTRESSDTVEVTVDSARCCGEILVRLVDKQAVMPATSLKNWSLEKIYEYQAECYRSDPARTFARDEDNGLALYRDVEILVGGAEITCEQDIRGAFARLSRELTTSRSSEKLPEFDTKKLMAYAQSLFLRTIRIEQAAEDGAQLLTISFDDCARQHRVYVTAAKGVACFEAVVANKYVTADLSREKLLDLTWRRNAFIDLVECLRCEDGRLVARSEHPLGDLNLEEFAFNCLLIAVEADRLEYLTKEPDEY